jgi:hypothetical protein
MLIRPLSKNFAARRYGGAVQEAGTVKAKGERRRATSDWMSIEQARSCPPQQDRSRHGVHVSLASACLATPGC